MGGDAWFPKTEGILYAYYRRQEKVDRLSFDLGQAQERLKNVMDDYKLTREAFCFTTPALVANYHSTPVQGGKESSHQEREVDRLGSEFERLENAMFKLARHVLRLKVKLFGLEEQNAALAYALSTLTEQEKELALLKYGDRVSNCAAAVKLHMAEASIRRARTRLVKKVAVALKLV